MAIYTLTRFDSILRTNTDGTYSSIPIHPDNSDYKAYLAWVAEGNTPDPADSAPLLYDDDGRLQRRVTTINETPTELFRFTLPTMTVFVAELKVVGIDTANGAVYVRKGDLAIRRLGAGASIVGSNLDPPMRNTPATDGWNVAGAASGNDFVITVTGAAGRTISWTLNGTYIAFTPNGRQPSEGGGGGGTLPG